LHPFDAKDEKRAEEYVPNQELKLHELPIIGERTRIGARELLFEIPEQQQPAAKAG
jgi:hypothetical protein